MSAAAGRANQLYANLPGGSKMPMTGKPFLKSPLYSDFII
jgi:hypothetical protein